MNLGYGADQRRVNALEFILNKRDQSGRRVLEKSLNGKMWIDIEELGKASKLVTPRALSVLKKADLARSFGVCIEAPCAVTH